MFVITAPDGSVPMGPDEQTMIVAYLSILLIPAIVGIFLGLLRNERFGKASVGLCVTSCIAGILCTPMYLYTEGFSAKFPLESFIGEYIISIDLITSIFVSISSVVFLMVVLHMSHSGHGYSNGYLALTCALFLSCVLCMMADSVILLLVSWEVVSLVTFLMADNNDLPRWRFFMITHIGGLVIMAVFGYLWVFTGTGDMGNWHQLSALMDDNVSSLLILALFLGFGTKLGTIPFHAWMPEMYATSPTHTTALLTTVCSNVAVLILFKSVFSWIGISNLISVFAVILCILSVATALWGAMESMVQTGPKRILAYSSMENMALVTMCLSLAMLFFDSFPALTSLVTVAALFHTMNHSVFKSLMMLTVDSIEDVTGERTIDRLGGIACVLPGLSAVALIGAMSLTAIPPMNGFVSEWLMLQALIGTDTVSSSMRVFMPLLIAMMGVCGMVVATSYARLYGFIFLGRPRSKGASDPRPLRKGSLAPLMVLALLCITMGLLSFPIMDGLSSGISDITLIDTEYRIALSGNLEPLTLGILLGGCILLLFLMTRIFRTSRNIDETWGCGGTLDERMQYSSEGFSQPIVRVFHPIYGDTTEKRGNRYVTRFMEPFVKYIYRPIGAGIVTLSYQVRRLQTGNIQSYLGYILITLMVALLAVRWL